MKAKFQATDIESHRPASLAERGMLAQHAGAEGLRYTEFALFEVPPSLQGRSALQLAFSEWVQKIPRLRELLIYEKVPQPLVIRLKKLDSSLEFLSGFTGPVEIFEWLGNQNWNWNLQQPALWKAFVFECGESQFFAFCYPHILLDGWSVRLAVQCFGNDHFPNASAKFGELPSENDLPVPNPFHLKDHLPEQGQDPGRYLDFECASLPFKNPEEVQAAWLWYLFLASGKEEVGLGEVFHGRGILPGDHEAIGFGVNVFPTGIRVDENECFADFLLRWKAQRSETWEERWVPLSARKGGIDAFDHVWLLDETSEEKAWFKAHFPYLLSIYFSANADSLNRLIFRWNASQVHPAIAEAFTKGFFAFLERLKENPSRKLGLDNWFPIQAPFEFPVGIMQELLTKACFEAADRLAIQALDGRQWSFSQLQAESEKVAQSLLALKISPGDRIGLEMEPSPELIACMLGAWLCRAAYVPIAPNLPASRKTYIRKDADIQLCITDQDDAEGMSYSELLDHHPAAVLDWPKAESTDLAYLIYTSGTTGEPKGCMLSQGNLHHLFANSLPLFPSEEQEQWMFLHNPSFDFSVWEIFGSLVSGACLHIPDLSTVQDSFALVEFMQSRRCSMLNITPRAFYNLNLAIGENARAVLPELKTIIFGGDKLDLSQLRIWDGHPCQIFNMYGITETTVHVTIEPLQRPVLDPRLVPIGKPLPGYGIELKGSRGQSLPPGIAGEMLVSGGGVCGGYWQKPTLTQQKFQMQSGQLAYHSGDLAWRDASTGALFYIGRADRQVKVRGHRIELAEIERALQLLPGVRSSLAHWDEKKAVLIGFVQAASTPAEWRAVLAGLLPPYAIPNSLVALEKLLLNANGKPDVEAMLMAAHSEQPNIAQDSEAMQALLTLWTGMKDRSLSFIENGGDSILAIQLISQMKKKGWLLSMDDLLRKSAINDWEFKPLKPVSTSLKPLLEAWNNKHLGQAPVGTQQVYPLSKAQQGILFDSLSKDEPELYFEQFIFEIQLKELSREGLRLAWNTLFERHPQLNWRLFQTQEGWLWRDDGKRQGEIEISETQFGIGVSIVGYAHEDRQKGFVLKEDALIRLRAVPQPSGHWSLILSHHHILLDGWSFAKLMEEFLALLEGKSNPSAEESQTAWLRFLEAQELESTAENRIFWEQTLSNVEKGTEVMAPLKRSFSEKLDSSEKVREFNFAFSKAAVESLRTFASRHAVTENVAFLATWSAFLSKWQDEDQICISTVISHRDQGFASALGLLNSTFVLPSNWHSDDWATSMEAFKQTWTGIWANRKLPDQLLSQVSAAKGHLVIFENYPIDAALRDASKLQLKAVHEHTGYAWNLLAYPETDGLAGKVLFDPKQYALLEVEEVIDQYLSWLQKLSSDSALPQLETEVDILVPSWGPSPQLPSLQHSLDLIDFQQHWNRIAWTDGEQEMSFGQLYAQAQILAIQMQKLGLQPNEAVWVRVAETRDFLVSMLGTWMSGAVFCPVDLRYPAARVQFIAQNAHCKLAISSKLLEPIELELPLLYLEDLPTKVLSELPKLQTQPEDPSFILHTSGSTGQPKGVVQTHACLLNLIDWNRNQFGLDAHTRLLQLSSFGFDASIHECLLALSLGATLVGMPLQDRQDIFAIKQCLVELECSLAWLPARLLNGILAQNAHFFDDCKHLSHVVATGEALQLSDPLRSWMQRRQIRLLNYYGPTETHVVTAFESQASDPDRPPIGFALPNCELRIVGKEGTSRPRGLPGELWVAGPHLAIGYVNQAELTAEKFVWKDGRRWYKTGDHVRADKDGNLIFQGRLDDQLKIRGFRVEVAEIEQVLQQQSGVLQAVVLPWQMPDTRLLACVVLDGRTTADLEQRLLDLLPDYMVPRDWMQLAAIPLTTNGKTDRGALMQGWQAGLGKKTAPKQGKAAQAWTAILGHGNFHSDSRFHEVGGNSISLMRMQAWFLQSFGWEIPLKVFLQNNTLASLDEWLERNAGSPRPIGEISESGKVGLNDAQIQILAAIQDLPANLEDPFLMEFCLTHPQFSDENWVKMRWSQLSESWPHLLARLDWQEREKPQLVWEGASEAVFERFDRVGHQPGQSLLGMEVRPSLSQVAIRAHHILLDGHAMLLLLEALLSEEAQVNPKRMTVASLPALKGPAAANLQLRFQPGSFHLGQIDAQSLANMEAQLSKRGLRLQTLWQALILAEIGNANSETSILAYTDASNALPIPFMQTQFALTKLAFDEGPTWNQMMENIQQQLNGNAPLADTLTEPRVLNYMDWSKFPMPEGFKWEAFPKATTRYAQEWQLIRTKEGLNISLLLPKQEESPLLENFLNTFFKWLEALELGQEPKLETKLNADDWADFAF